ncbi:response regulator [Vagococcus salmoninarum]|uniref:Transcriptional regulatory protein n=1 Tax=Vagococcus salmoninarum TaxID=2739 RepID=A0A429ZFC6_9ENTE|nr:response regulator [Vagococcus salmoninarum]RST92408.1 hypothetical protein CBF35_13225 [Vagococcus salmoninarum]
MTYQTLIIEDDPMVLYINQHYLEKVPGFSFAGSATTFDDGLHLLTNQSFDLVLVDVHLISGNGFDLVKSIRQQGLDVDIIMITAANESQDIQEMLRYGVVDYILKPFKFERFQESLLQFAERNQRLTEQSHLSQKTFDELYNNLATVSPLPIELEKGLTHQTLEMILDALEKLPPSFTINDLSQSVELSHVSIRKYIKYLEEQKIISSSIEYGTIGRPNTFYRKVT